MNYTILLDVDPEQLGEGDIHKLISQIEGVRSLEIKQGDETNFDYHTIVRWHDEDIVVALGEEDFPATDKNIDLVRERFDSVRDYAVGVMWDGMKDAISDLAFENKLDKDGDM